MKIHNTQKLNGDSAGITAIDYFKPHLWRDRELNTKPYRWSNEQIRDQVKVLDEAKNPHTILKNATYLNTYLHQWITANIWIYEDRIVYVGEKLPEHFSETAAVDCSGKYLVPGYIEPHAHPYQLYNPMSFAEHAGQYGTTTLINDNLPIFTMLSAKTAHEFLDDFKHIPCSMYWWCRLDGQTELPNEEELFTDEKVTAWLQHETVLQAGELTAWPNLVNGDDTLLSWMQETHRLHKKIEGHLPGASERTLAKLMLFGADCDHEAMTGQEALARLMQGYTVSLRHSSIRPDLEVLLKELMELGVQKFERFFFTTDGSHPYFYENGMNDQLIKIAIDLGVPLIDAYQMAGYNIARYYNIEHLHGSIATGRIANINVLESKHNPTPVSVMAKGKWIKKEGINTGSPSSIDWSKYQMAPLDIKWSLQKEDLRFENPTGVHLINNVITKPYESRIDLSSDDLSLEHDECYFMMIAKDGSFRINTVLKGFARQLGGFATSYSYSGCLIIGKRKADMKIAFERLKTLGGGMVLAENHQVLHELPLPLNGMMTDLPMSVLIKKEKEMIQLLKERGFPHSDLAFATLFFSATHLPYVRLTPMGLYDVKERKVLVPPSKRMDVQV